MLLLAISGVLQGAGVAAIAVPAQPDLLPAASHQIEADVVPREVTIAIRETDAADLAGTLVEIQESSDGVVSSAVGTDGTVDAVPAERDVQVLSVAGSANVLSELEL